jgi:acetyl esterase/lipase
MDPPPQRDDGVKMVTRTISGQPGGAPDVALVIYSPEGQTGALPALLDIHGGGHVMGAPSLNEARSHVIVKEVGCVVVAPDYRLAPEHPFPNALEDVYTALQWLHRHAGELAVDPTRIAISGDSAGGGIAASLAQMARDRAEVPVIFQLLTYPMLDNRSGATIDRGPYCGEFVWTKEANAFCWDALLGLDHLKNEPRPYAAPGRCRDLAGLPPAFIAVGAIDLLAEENIEYAQRLIRAGVPTELHVYPGAYHGFDVVKAAWASRSFQSHKIAALRRALHPSRAA